MQAPAACLPIAAAALFYGWAALATVTAMLASTLIALAIWSRIGRRGRQLNLPQCLWMSLLLALALPAQLIGKAWPILPAAAILLVMVQWLVNTIGSGRVHPVALTYLLLFIFFEPLLTPHLILKRDHPFFGNLFSSRAVAEGASSAEAEPSLNPTTPWIYQTSAIPSPNDALDNPHPAGEILTAYTSGRQQPERFSLSAQMVLRDQLPPLENLVIGGEPGPIGASSAVILIVGGLFLICQGLIDYRVPLFAVAAAMLAFLILPIPVIINETGPRWHWLALRHSYLGVAAGVTLADYELFASPLLLVAFFMATSVRSRPMSGRGCIVFGLILGLGSAAAQLYGSAVAGPYVALLLASLLSRWLDRLFPPRTLV
jgi:Na+-translocating ferredoxin:NAD+ oxidoreductase subunit D